MKKQLYIHFQRKRLISFGLSLLMLLSIIGAYNIRSSVASAETKAIDDTPKRSVMYYSDECLSLRDGAYYPKDIPAELYTHLLYAYLDFDTQGNLIFYDEEAAISLPLGTGAAWGAGNGGILPALINVKAANPTLKLGVSIGGSVKSADFSVIAGNSALRKKFAQNLVSFMDYVNMDFIEIAWEYPARADRANYILLINELRSALDAKSDKTRKTYELSVVLPASQYLLNAGFQISSLFPLIDFANVKTFDFRGESDIYTGHHTNLYANPSDPYSSRELSIHETVTYLKQNAAPPEKIVIGAAFYGRGWRNAEVGYMPALPGLFGYINNSFIDKGTKPGAVITPVDWGIHKGEWPYARMSEIKQYYPNVREYWDNTAKAQYMYDQSKSIFFSYDNIRSVTEKAEYVNRERLGGILASKQYMDRITIQNSLKRDELSKVIKRGLFGDAELPYNFNDSTPLNIQVEIYVVPDGYGSNGVFNITIKNKEVRNETNTVLQSVEKIHETILLPKLYIKTDAVITGGGYGSGSISRNGNYVIVDLQNVYDARFINQGGSYQFQLYTNTREALVRDIQSIELAQRVYIQGSEYGRQTIYERPANRAPVIYGVTNKLIHVEESFDPMSGVRATDAEDGNLTNAILITGEVHAGVIGVYQLNYYVEDSEGASDSADRTIEVVDADTFRPEIPYSSGDIVYYNGLKYIAKWWVQGGIPGIDSAWELCDRDNSEYAPDKTYYLGDIVIYESKVYKALWWNQGMIPGIDPCWQLIGEVFDESKIYVSGDIVL